MSSETKMILTGPLEVVVRGTSEGGAVFVLGQYVPAEMLTIVLSRFYVETVVDAGKQVGWVRDRHEDDYPVFRGESVSQAEAVCDALNADHEADRS